VLAVVSVVWSYRVRRYRVEGARLAKIVAASAASVGVWRLVQGSSLGVLAVSAMVSLATFPAVLWLLRFPTAGELATASEVVRRVLARERA